MNAKKRLDQLKQYFLGTFKTPEQQQYPGFVFHAPESKWREGYGVKQDDGLPDFVKRDNEGWVYIRDLDEPNGGGRR